MGVLIVLLCCIVLQRIEPNTGNLYVSLSLLAVYGFLAHELFCNRLLVCSQRLLAYGLCMLAAGASVLVNRSFSAPGTDVSLASLALLVTLYLPLIFRIRWPMHRRQLVLDYVATIGFVCALVGIAQFYLQFVIHDAWLFDISPYLPARLYRPSGYNTIIDVGDHYKANGFFFREPAGFSFMMALGLVTEWLQRRRWPRLACLALGLVLSYSGTGLLVLATALLVPFGGRTFLRIIAVAGVGALLYWLLGDLLNLSFTLGRVHEFESTGSSAYARYVAPLRFVGENLESSPWTLLVGHGPGSISRASQLAFGFHDPTWAKLLHEYGLSGCGAFVLLIWTTLRHSGLPLQLRAAIGLNWLLMGGHLLKAESIALIFALCVLYPAGSQTHVENAVESPSRWFWRHSKAAQVT